MGPHPIPLRATILDARTAGRSTAVCVQLFGVSRSSVYRYVRQWRTTGTLAPRRSPGRPPLISPEQQSLLVAMVESQPGATLAQYRQRWHETTGVWISTSALSRTLGRLGFQRDDAR